MSALIAALFFFSPDLQHAEDVKKLLPLFLLAIEAWHV